MCASAAHSQTPRLLRKTIPFDLVMSESWICRSFRDGDEAGILQLYRDVFQLDLTLPVWQRAYQQCPNGPAVITVLENDGDIVGHYAVQPRGFWVSGERCIAGI